jgi:hypothetical protein
MLSLALALAPRFEVRVMQPLTTVAVMPGMRALKTLAQASGLLRPTLV